MLNFVLLSTIIVHAANVVNYSGDTTLVRIISVSTVEGQENSVPQGSTEGGTRLFLKVQGLDVNPGNNTVFIGKYPCLMVEQGLNGLSLTCETTKPKLEENNLSNLEIVVRVVGRRDSLCTFSDIYCFFTYTKEKKVLELKLVSPRSNYPNRVSSWKAQWGINSTQYLKGQLIGIHRCITEDSESEINTNDIINCQLPKNIEAGEYDYSFLTYTKISTKSPSLSEKKIFSDETYDSKIIPIITSLNTNFGSPKGQILTINGYGFSSITSENVITITNQNLNYGDSIQILSSTNTRIKVKLPDLNEERTVDPAESNKLYISGSGLFYTKYNLEGQDTFYENCEKFRRQLLENPSAFTNLILTDGIYPEPEILEFSNQQYFGEYLRGFLKAPSTGNYKFYLSSQNQALFYLQTELTMSTTSSNLIMGNNTWNPFRNYWYSQIIDPQSDNPSISKSIQLTKDKYYFIELFRVSKEQNQYLTLSMEMENNSGERKSNSIKQIWKIATSSPPVSGTFQLELSINNVVNKFRVDDDCQDIPFDFSAELMADNFERIMGSRPIVQTYGEANDGWIWIIQFQAGIENQMDIKINKNNLIGDISVVNVIQENDNLLFEPIPNEILYAYSDKLQVQVETKGILAGCETRSTCDFTITGDRILTLMNYEVNGSKLNLTLVAGQGKNDLLAKDLIITFLNAACYNIKVINSASPYQVICDIEQFNGENLQEAGKNQFPIVYDKNTGYSFVDENLQGTDVDLVISSLYPTTGTPDGGTLVTLLGTGFPKSIYSDFTIELPDKAQIISANPYEIKFLTLPNMESEKMRLLFNNMQANIDFIINSAVRMQIWKLPTNEATPYDLQDFQIYCKEFGNTLDDITIILNSPDKKYQLKPSKLDSNSRIFINLNGLQLGNYEPLIHRTNFGFSYSTLQDKVILLGLTPVCQNIKGSPQGGALVSISFKGVGSFYNLKLHIANKSVTQLEVGFETFTFRIPPKDSNLPDGKYNYQIQFPEHFVPIEDCYFEYDSSLTLKINNYPTNAIMVTEDNLTIYKKYYYQNQTETVSGSNLGQIVGVIIGNYSIYASQNQNTLQYTIPNINPGEYLTQVYNEYGYADKIWITVIQEKELKILSIIPSPIYPGGMPVFYFTVEGFLTSLPIQLSIGSNQSPKCSYGKTSNPFQTDFLCEMERQSELGEAAITISQFTSMNNSGILKIAQFNFTMIELDKQPTVTSITINGRDTYDNNLKAHQAQDSQFSIAIGGDQLDQLFIQLKRKGKLYNTYKVNFDSTTFTAYFRSIPVGSYRINLIINQSGYLYMDDDTKLNLLVGVPAPNISSPLLAYSGGQLINLTFQSEIYHQSDNLKVKVCGFDCQIESFLLVNSFIQCNAPSIKTLSLFRQYPSYLQQYRFLPSSELILTSDNDENVYYLYDNKEETYYQSESSSCFFQFSFSYDRTLSLQQLSFLLRQEIDVIQLAGGAFQYSVDGSNWIDLLKLQNTIISGWNHFILSEIVSNILVLRYVDDRVENNSKCQFAEIKLKGEIFHNDNQPVKCDVEIHDDEEYVSQIIPSAVTYINTSLPIVYSVAPIFSGQLVSNTTVSIMGTGFIKNQTLVLINEAACQINNITPVKIVCKRDLLNELSEHFSLKFEVKVNGVTALNFQKIYQVYKWSDRDFNDDVWDVNKFQSTEPRAGDSIIIPKGVTLLVDYNPPNLNQIIVQGTLIFSDENDISINANQIFIQGGTLQIGSEAQRHQHKVVITLRGDETTQSQLPGFGNKFIVCQSCQINIFGEERTPIWTYLSCTAEVGQIEITLDDEVDWRIGEQIIIVTNSFDNSETEKKEIVAVSEDRKTLTLDSPLLYQHYSAYETYDNQTLAIKTEVGLLTRNIVIQGELQNKNFGYHLFIYGEDYLTKTQISYAEFINGGQYGLYSRYPINLQIYGLQTDSYLIGNSIHDSYARCINIQGTQNLKIQKNICYNIEGHGIALQAGLFNIIEENLVINTRQSWTLDESDVYPASFYIKNPNNILRNNRAVGSEWIGFYYDINSKLKEIISSCLIGVNSFEFINNLAHTIAKAGLEIKQLYLRKNSCNHNDNDEINPNVQALFQNFQTWFVNGNGIILREVQNLFLKNISISNFQCDGISYHEIDNTIQSPTISNSLLILSQIEEKQFSYSVFINAAKQLLQKDVTLKNITAFNKPQISCFFNFSTNETNSDPNSNSSSNVNGSDVINNTNETNSISLKQKYWSDPDAWANNQVPSYGDNVIIPQGFNVILNINPPEIKYLEIRGTLTFDPNEEELTLKTQKIKIESSGKLIAGNSSNPHQGKINIILIGQQNNQILVQNGLELFSVSPKTTQTRLIQVATKFSEQIQVQSCLDWKIGDEIVFGPSGVYVAEKRFIVNIEQQNCKITLHQRLTNPHYGAQEVTINKPGIGTLDMRPVVINLSRKIIIKGSDMPCQVLIQKSPELTSSGYAILYGVEFENCGNDNLQQAGLEFQNSNKYSEIIECSFHDSQGIQLKIFNSTQLRILSNVFYYGITALVQINNSKNLKFQRNALVYVRRAENYIDGGALGNFTYFGETNPTRMIRDIVDVSENVGQGSEDTGFIIMSSSCSDSEQTAFYNNECSSSFESCFVIRQSNGSCDYVQGMSSYHSKIGVYYAINSAKLKLEKVISAENQVGVVLISGSDNFKNNKMHFSNSYITTLARLSYEQGDWTSYGAAAVMMGTVLQNINFSYLDIFYKFESKPIVQRVDLQVYINGVEFNRFSTYTLRNNNPIMVPYSAFITNENAVDMTGQHYLSNSSCTDCDLDGSLKFINLNDNKYKNSLQYFSTAQKNVLIEDQTGHFFGQIGQAILYNNEIGNSISNCINKTDWNGFWCTNKTLTVLMFMSIAPDYNTSLYSPVDLNDGQINNTVQSFSDWSNFTFLNRQSKYISLVQVNKWITVTGVGENPTDTEFWLSKRKENGSPEDYVIIEWQFNVAQMIQVSVNNNVIQPGISTISQHFNLNEMINLCGSNNYFYENRTIQFVINGQIDCLVRISIKNTLFVTTLLQIDNNNTFSSQQFLEYAIQTLGGNPLNYFILDQEIQSNRLLQEGEQELIIKVLWGIVDEAQIGTKESLSSELKLSQFATALESFSPPSGLGVVLQQSSQIVSKAKLAEQDSKDNSKNDTSNEQNQNNNSSIYDLELIINEAVNEKQGINIPDQNNQTNQQQDLDIHKEDSQNSNATILISIICPIIGLIFIILGYCYYRKQSKARITPIKTLTFIEDPELQLKSPQNQMTN